MTLNLSMNYGCDCTSRPLAFTETSSYRHDVMRLMYPIIKCQIMCCSRYCFADGKGGPCEGTNGKIKGGSVDSGEGHCVQRLPGGYFPGGKAARV